MALDFETSGVGLRTVLGSIPHRTLDWIAHLALLLKEAQEGNTTLLSRGAHTVVNVLHFGADPTGTDDSTDAIQSAIDEAKASGASTVYFPRGTYLVSNLVVHRVAGLTLRGEGVVRSPGTGWDNYSAGTVLKGTGASSSFLLHLRWCYACRVENITFQCDSSASRPNTRNCVQITTTSGAGSSGNQFINCVFAYADIAYQCGGEDSLNDAENLFLFSHWIGCNDCYKITHGQALVHILFGCTVAQCVTMFNVDAGGCILCVGLTGANLQVLMDVAAGGSNIGPNRIINTRIDHNDGLSYRVKLYNASGSGTQRTIIDGIHIAGVDPDNGATRITMRTGHQVWVNNFCAGGGISTATNTSRLVDWVSGGTDKSRLTLQDCELNTDYFLSGSLLGISEYVISRPYTVAGGRTASLAYPLLDLTDTIQFYAASSSGGSPTILNTVEIEEGRIVSWSQAAPGTGGQWDFSDSGQSAHILTAGF